MRHLTLQEVVNISGGDSTPILQWSGNDLIQWGAAYFGLTQGYAYGSGLSALTIAEFEVGALGMGALGGAVGLTFGYILGKVFSDQILKRID